MRKINSTAATLVIAALAVGSASAAIISVNFAENPGNQVFVGGENIGPLATDSANWNSTIDADTGGLGTGTKADLIDDTGTATTADISWAAANAWWGADGTANDERMLGVGELDDGTGILITMSEIPYAQYRVYGLISSDAGWNDPAGFEADNPLVNGTWIFGGDGNTSRTSYSSVNITEIETGSSWVEGSDTALGNYWTLETSGDLSIAITKNIGRASISGLVIEQIPEPATFGMLAVFGGGIFFIRRRLKR